MELKPFQRQPLREAILSAFPDPSKLEMLLYERLDISLNEVVAVGKPYGELVFDLIKWAQSEDRLADLLSSAYQRNPRNPKFRQFMAAFGLEANSALVNSAVSSSALAYPDFTWRGPKDETSLQSLWRPDPEIWDVGFLKRGLEQVNAVCRIELPEGTAIGTGFLIAPNYLLTSYHVIDNALTGSEPASQLALRFATLTDAAGGEMAGPVLKLASNSLKQSSPTHQLDYALLELEAGEPRLANPVRFSSGRSPTKNDSINLFHHPSGQTMKVSLSSHGISGVYQEEGLVQYVSKTAPGSSGSPCFNEDWELVAIHHAEVAGALGVKCEGILFSAIYPEIRAYLS
jgi:endonuclease G, mitochondrial